MSSHVTIIHDKLSEQKCRSKNSSNFYFLLLQNIFYGVEDLFLLLLKLQLEPVLLAPNERSPRSSGGPTRNVASPATKRRPTPPATLPRVSLSITCISRGRSAGGRVNPLAQRLKQVDQVCSSKQGHTGQVCGHAPAGVRRLKADAVVKRRRPNVLKSQTAHTPRQADPSPLL